LVEAGDVQEIGMVLHAEVDAELFALDREEDGHQVAETVRARKDPSYRISLTADRAA